MLKKTTLSKKFKWDISYAAILKIIVVIALLIFLYLIRDILLILFVAFIVASAIIPAVNKMESKGIPRFLSVLLLYLVLISIITTAVILIAPPISSQVSQLAGNLPEYYHRADMWFQGLQDLGIGAESTSFDSLIQSNWSAILGSGRAIFSTVGGVLGGLFAAILALVIAFYISVQKDSLVRLLRLLIPKKKNRVTAEEIITKIQEKMGAWLKGQLLLCLIIAVLCYIGLTALGIKYALVLALIAGITEIVPYVGPFVGAVPAILVALTQSPLLALLVIILYTLVQQLENAFITPNIMRKAIGLNPIITIVAIVAGGKLAGIGGAIIALPLAVTVSILLKSTWKHRAVTKAPHA